MMSLLFLIAPLLLIDATQEVVYDLNERSRSLIYGGSKVDSESSYPYNAVVIATRQFYNETTEKTEEEQTLCGGVLIAKDVVLTMGHCFDHSGLKKILTIFETIQASDSDRQLIAAKSWKVDEASSTERALGLIFLENEVDGIDPVNLAVDIESPAEEEPITIMGFGFTEGADEINDHLLEVTLEVKDTATCDENHDQTLTDTKQFCAGGDGKGACSGDAGGPAINENGDCVGITSFGNEACGISPTIFVRVSGNIDYLRSNVCGRDDVDDAGWCQSDSGGGGFAICFAGSGKVEVQNEDGETREVEMREISIGDKVNTGNGIFEPVYSFGHHSPFEKAKMLEIKTDSKSNLRLSPNHMVMTASNGAIPASQVKVGDQLVNSLGILVNVKKIDDVIVDGIYAPFTPSGKIVVDGILASSYIAFEDSKSLQLMGGLLNISHQWMAHAGSFPHRMMCYYYPGFENNYCENETYTSEGISEGVHPSFLFYKKLFDATNGYHYLIHGTMFCMVMVLLMAFSFIEHILINRLNCAVMIFGASILFMRRLNNFVLKVKQS